MSSISDITWGQERQQQQLKQRACKRLVALRAHGAATQQAQLAGHKLGTGCRASKNVLRCQPSSPLISYPAAAVHGVDSLQPDTASAPGCTSSMQQAVHGEAGHV